MKDWYDIGDKHNSNNHISTSTTLISTVFTPCPEINIVIVVFPVFLLNIVEFLCFSKLCYICCRRIRLRCHDQGCFRMAFFLFGIQRYMQLKLYVWRVKASVQPPLPSNKIGDWGEGRLYTEAIAKGHWRNSLVRLNVTTSRATTSSVTAMGQLFKRSLATVQQNCVLSRLQFAERFYWNTIYREQFHQ